MGSPVNAVLAEIFMVKLEKMLFPIIKDDNLATLCR